MLNIVLTISSGAVVGWMAGLVIKTRGGLLVNLVTGILGALVAGYVFGQDSFLTGTFSIRSLLWSFIGAIVLLAAVKLLGSFFKTR